MDKKSEDKRVNLESTLYYITHHSETIIQWLFLTILLLSVLVIARSVFGKKTADSQVAGSGPKVMPENGEIQSFLTKILEQTAKLETVSLQKLEAGTAGPPDAQVQSLKKELQEREDELVKLKANGTPTAGAGPGADVVARIKELESKLAEYEILEDDIADLSLYKEENVRLKEELEKAKNAVNVANPEVGGMSAAILPAPPVDSGEDIVAQFAEAVHHESAPDLVPNTIDSAPDPLADFETLLKTEKANATAAKTQAAIAAPSPFDVAPAAVPVPSAPEADDLFAEFASVPAEKEAPVAGLDTDRMMEEMAALATVEPTHDRALDNESIDTEKMAHEALNLVKS
jgi:hypothetical protein